MIGFDGDGGAMKDRKDQRRFRKISWSKKTAHLKIGLRPAASLGNLLECKLFGLTPHLKNHKVWKYGQENCFNKHSRCFYHKQKSENHWSTWFHAISGNRKEKGSNHREPPGQLLFH